MPIKYRPTGQLAEQTHRLLVCYYLKQATARKMKRQKNIPRNKVGLTGVHTPAIAGPGQNQDRPWAHPYEGFDHPPALDPARRSYQVARSFLPPVFLSNLVPPISMSNVSDLHMS